MLSGIDKHLNVETQEGVTIAKLVDEEILEEMLIDAIGKEMFELIPDGNPARIVLDFSVVKLLTSGMLGKLVVMHNRVDANQGEVRLCNIRPEILEVFRITTLDKRFDLHDDLASALQGI
jgi:anti-anti-sigma factor